jgi:hypothetical protein
MKVLHKLFVLTNANRISVLVPNNSKDSMNEFINVGKPRELKFDFAFQVLSTGQPKSFSMSDSRREGGTLPAANNGKFYRVSSALGLRIESSLSGALGIETVFCIPLVNESKVCLAVTEMTFLGELNQQHQEVLTTFAIAGAAAIEKLNLPELAAVGYGQPELNWYIDPEELARFAIPRRLVFQDDVFGPAFNVDKYRGIALFKVVFRIFDRFRLLDSFKISAELLFRFLLKVSSLYNKQGRYNWAHAVNVTQYVAYLLILAKLEGSYVPKYEILALLLSALCHDVNHDVYENSIAYSLLLHESGFLESVHITTAQQIFEDPECSILRSLGRREETLVWQLVVELILGTDMSMHFNILQQFRQLVEAEQFSPQGKLPHRMLMLKMFLKAADLADVLRPTSDFSKWTPDLAEEFYRTGDLSKITGVVVAAADPTYEKLDREAALMGFLKDVCWPLAQLLPRVGIAMKQIPEIVKDNMKKWAKKTDRPVPQFEAPSKGPRKP